MTNKYMGILTLSENETDIRSLTINRPIASIPVGGRYRVIDFVLSNMVNSGIQNIGIFSQSNSRSLVDHLGTGKPWDLDRKIGGLFLFNFSIGSTPNCDMKIIKNNLEYLYRSKEENVIISPSYMMCNIDYKEAIKSHEASGKDITVIYKRVNTADKDMINCDVLNIGGNNTVLSVGKNTGLKKHANISLEMFILKKETLIQLIFNCIQTGYYSNLKDSIYESINNLEINAYEFQGYLQCINSIKHYFTTNMDLLKPNIRNDLCFKNGPIFTKVKDEPPTKCVNGSKITNCLISNGCTIKGTIKNSIISRKVVIENNSHIENCIILQGCTIKSGSTLKNVIIDKNRTIESGSILNGSSEFPLVIEKESIINSLQLKSLNSL